MFEHFVKSVVVLRLLHNLLVLEVVEAVSHPQANLVLVLEVAHHKFQTELLERHRLHNPQLQGYEEVSNRFEEKISDLWTKKVKDSNIFSEVNI